MGHLTPGLGISHALRLAFSYTAAWLSPAKGDPPYSWVVTGLDEARQGDVLVLPSEQMSESVVTQAQEQHLTALVLVGKHPIQDISFPPGLPIALIEKQMDARVVQKELLGLLLDQRRNMAARGASISAQFARLVAEGAGLAGLTVSLSEITDRGVIFQDKRLEVLAEQASVELSEQWEAIHRAACLMEYLPEVLRDRKRAPNNAGLLSVEIPGGFERLIAPIVVGDVTRGYISLIGPAGQIDELDQVALEQAAVISAVEMSRLKSVHETEKRLRGDLLTALLEENLSPRDARLWVQALGMDPDQSCVALRFAWESANPPSRRRLETLINGEIARTAAQVTASPLGVEVICFYTLPANQSRPEAAIHLAENVLEQAQREFPAISLCCGVGMPADNLSGWRDSFRQAGQAMELARRLGVRRPLYFSDLSVYRLLMQIEDSPELMAYQEQILGNLLAHESSEEFLRTLSAYFEHNGNLSQTAEALYIHRNTLLYRMERIGAISRLNLEESETRLAIQLALHIHRMHGGNFG